MSCSTPQPAQVMKPMPSVMAAPLLTNSQPFSKTVKLSAPGLTAGAGDRLDAGDDAGHLAEPEILTRTELLQVWVLVSHWA
jgi:hypothetical protein